MGFSLKPKWNPSRATLRGGGAKDAAALRPAVWKATFCRNCKIVNVQLMKPSKSASIEINYTEWYRKQLT